VINAALATRRPRKHLVTLPAPDLLVIGEVLAVAYYRDAWEVREPAGVAGDRAPVTPASISGYQPERYPRVSTKTSVSFLGTRL